MADVMAVANLFLHLAEEQANQMNGDLMTDLKLQKMLYFAQCWFLARHGKPLFNNRIEAWNHGPVVPDVYEAYKTYGCNPLHAAPVNYDQFTTDEFSTILDVFAFYGKYSASGLRELSHKSGSPWAAVYVPGVKHIEITAESMKDYFKKQDPLETAADRIRRFAKESGRDIITPAISAKGNPILPADDDEDWDDDQTVESVVG